MKNIAAGIPAAKLQDKRTKKMLKLAIEIMREIEARKDNFPSYGDVEWIELVAPAGNLHQVKFVAYNISGGSKTILFDDGLPQQELLRRKEHLFSALSKDGGPSLSDFDLPCKQP